MTEPTYPFAIDPGNGRARVTISGAIRPEKIGNTYIAISMQRDWLEGDMSILWLLENAVFDASFEFSDILEVNLTARHYIRPGRSAIVVESTRAMQEKVARFYKGMAAASTTRQVAIFYSQNEAMVWLDT